VNNFIDVQNEDVLHNWIDRASMSISKVRRPFRAAKEMHLVTIQVLIDIYSRTRSYVVDLSTSLGMCLSSKNPSSISMSIFLSNHLSPYMQHCQGLPKPWVPRLGFGVRYEGFYKSVGASC
jgi:hypothetical protein